MKSEKEIKELYEDLQEIKVAIHPSLLYFAEWILEIGNNHDHFRSNMKGLADAHRRRKK